MYVADFGFYLHRYGLSSYWVRESRNKNIGKLASLLIDKYLNQFEIESQSRVRNSDGKWFDKIDREPLKLLDFNIGQAGTLVNKTISRRPRYAISRIISLLRAN